MSDSDAERLLAEGVELKLGEETVTLRYSGRALAKTEDRFGSLMAFEKQMREVVRRSYEKAAVSFVLKALGALLEGTPWTEERISDTFRLGDMAAYLDAIGAAWDQAWPASDEKASRPGEAQAATGGSLGEDSGAPPSETATSVPATSGN